MINRLKTGFRDGRLGLLVALAAAIVIFSNNLRGEFILDDRYMIEDNPRVHSWQFLPDYFTAGVWHNSGFSDAQEIHAVYYRPLHLVLLRLTYAAFGADTLGYHVVNLLLFLANIVLVYLLARRLLEQTGRPDPIAAAAAALIFAVHPTHSESVSWISGVTDPLAFLFVIASLLFYFRSDARDEPLSFAASLVCYALGLLTKETVVVLPALLVAYNVIFQRPVFPKRLWAYVALTIVFLIVRAAALDESIPIYPSVHGFRFLIEFIAGYAKLLFVPWPMNYYFAAQAGTVASLTEIAIWGVIVCVVLVWAARHWRDEPLIAFGVVWIAATLAPTLIWAFNEFPGFAVRYLYPPTIGLGFIVARVVQLTRGRWPVQTLASIAAVAIVFASLTWAKNADWENEERFFVTALAVPTHMDEIYAAPLALLGKYYLDHDKTDQAIHFFLEAEKVGNIPTRAFCYENIGLIFGERGDYARSTEYYARANQLKPNKSSVLVGLGNNAYATKDLQAALRYYSLAYQADARNRSASYNLSLVYAALGDVANATRYRRISESITDEFVQ